MVGIRWFSDCIRSRLQEASSVCYPHTKYPGKTAQVGDAWTIPPHLPVRNIFPGAPGDHKPGSCNGCRCGLSTRWYWDGPMICNKIMQGGRGGQSVMWHGERLHVNTLQLHVQCYLLHCLFCANSRWFFLQCSCKRDIGPYMRLWRVAVVHLQGVKVSALHLFSGGVGQNLGAHTFRLCCFF